MFRTPIEHLESELKIAYGQKILSLGSCFAESIGLRLKESKFKSLVNPFGTIFNPLSLFELLEMSLERSEIIEQSILKRDGVFYNYKFHSSLNDKSKKKLFEKIEERLNRTRNALLDGNTLILTFGSAWVYQEKNLDMLVANCHKQPQGNFEKRLLNLEDIVPAFFAMKELVNRHNPDIKILLTVSPVRHTRDTLALNAVSKSVLRLACHYMSTMSDQVHYFPSYEIVLDDLRDYRFFEKDMIHPNEVAIDYVWNKFIEAHMDQDTQETLAKWSKLKTALDHKAFNPKGPSHQKFLATTLEKLKALNGQIDLDKEIRDLSVQLEKHA